MKSVKLELESAFANLDEKWRKTLDRVHDERIFGPASSEGDATGASSFGGLLLRSAAMVEQVFGGLNAALWDDPLEWTLPESMRSKAKMLEYLDEVRKTREEGFARIKSDKDLRQQIRTPAGLKTLEDVLVGALVKANEYQALAEADFTTSKPAGP